MTINQPNPEAVEAAARALADERWGPGEWVGVPDGPLLRQARAALSAALPLLPDVGDLLAEMDRLRAAAVKPDRDTIARAIVQFWTADLEPDERVDDSIDAEAGVLADAVLALLPGRTEAEVKAEALREAADALPPGYGLHPNWLRDRASRIERGES